MDKISRSVVKFRNKIQTKLPLVQTLHDNSGHWYGYKDHKFPSVTAKLQVIKDAGLANWKMNQALSVIRDATNAGVLNPGTVEEILQEAKNKPQIYFQTAGDVGTAVHRGREIYYDAWIANNKKPDYNVVDVQRQLDAPYDQDLRVTAGLRAIDRFLFEKEAIPVVCELKLANEKLKLGGSLDDLMVIPKRITEQKDEEPWGKAVKVIYKPELWLIDLKTSNIARKASYVAQLGLYYHMFQKMTGIRPDRVGILHTEKLDGSYELIEIKNIKQVVKDAIKVVEFNDVYDRLDSAKNPTRIRIDI